MKKFILLLLVFIPVLNVNSQSSPLIIPLWENGAPGFEDRKNEPEEAKEYWVKNVNNPSATVFKAENPNGSAVLIFPGGGHRLLVYDEEGTKTAGFLNTLGVTGIVVKYRLFREAGSPYTPENTKEDAIRAMRLVRSKADAWGIDPDRIGVMGFSAGGEVVSMLVYDDFPGNKQANDPVEKVSANPNFQIEIYPGPLGIPEKIKKDAIPAFVLASNNDKCCSESILQLVQAYRKAGAPIEAHLYDKGDHGFNMGDRSAYKSISKWPDRLADWLEDNMYFAGD